MGKRHGKTQPRWVRAYLLGMILFASLATAGYQRVTGVPRQQDQLIARETSRNEDRYGNRKQDVPAGTFGLDGETYHSRTVFTDSGKFAFLFRDGTRGQELAAVYQELPEGRWVMGSLPVTPAVARLVDRLAADVGQAVSMSDAETVVTTTGTYTVVYRNEHAMELWEGETLVGSLPLQITVEPRVEHYLADKLEDIGNLEEVLHVQTDEEKQAYYFRTDSGLYRLDAYFDGSAELLKGEEESEKAE